MSLAAVALVCVIVALRVAPGPGADSEPVAQAEQSPKDEKAEEPQKAEQSPKDEKAEKAEVVPDAGTQKDPGERASPFEMVVAAVKGDDEDADKKKDKPGDGGAPSAHDFPYKVNAPDSTFVLDRTLNEISGLSASTQKDSLWAVHDERPTLFRISTTDGAILQELDLGKRGDYESLEEVDGKVYIARSDGVLIVADPAGGDPTRLNFESNLGLACDLEGVAYEPKKKRLLMSCKNESSKSRKSNKAFEIYGMDLESKKMAKEPAFILNEQDIDEWVTAHPERTELKSAKGKAFAPSGLAVHPTTGELYIISTRGKMMAVLRPDGKLTHLDTLEPEVHPQPEGIAFLPDGTLFISNEAHGKRALLHVFKAKKGGKGKN